MQGIIKVVRFLYSIKVYFLILGAIITIIGCFLPLFTTCSIDANEDVMQIPIFGYTSFNYLLGIPFLLIIFALSRVINYKSGTIVFVVSLIFIALIQGYTKLGEAGFGHPCGKSPTIYLHIAHIGNLLIVFEAIFTALAKQIFPKRKQSSSLLDDEWIQK